MRLRRELRALIPFGRAVKPEPQSQALVVLDEPLEGKVIEAEMLPVPVPAPDTSERAELEKGILRRKAYYLAHNILDEGAEKELVSVLKNPATAVDAQCATSWLYRALNVIEERYVLCSQHNSVALLPREVDPQFVAVLMSLGANAHEEHPYRGYYKSTVFTLARSIANFRVPFTQPHKKAYLGVFLECVNLPWLDAAIKDMPYEGEGDEMVLQAWQKSRQMLQLRQAAQPVQLPLPLNRP